MKDCFLWLLNLSSNQREPSNNKSRFGSPMFLEEEHNFKKTMTNLGVLQDKWKE